MVCERCASSESLTHSLAAATSGRQEQRWARSTTRSSVVFPRWPRLPPSPSQTPKVLPTSLTHHHAHHSSSSHRVAPLRAFLDFLSSRLLFIECFCVTTAYPFILILLGNPPHGQLLPANAALSPLKAPSHLRCQPTTTPHLPAARHHRPRSRACKSSRHSRWTYLDKPDRSRPILCDIKCAVDRRIFPVAFHIRAHCMAVLTSRLQTRVR